MKKSYFMSITKLVRDYWDTKNKMKGLLIQINNAYLLVIWFYSYLIVCCAISPQNQDLFSYYVPNFDELFGKKIHQEVWAFIYCFWSYTRDTLDIYWKIYQEDFLKVFRLVQSNKGSTQNMWVRRNRGKVSE